MKTRLCTGCDQEKPLDLQHFTKDKHDPTGFTYRCKVCRAKAEKEWRERNKDKVKAINAKHKETRREYYASPERKLKYRKKFIERSFGIKYEQYDQMLEEQKGVCAICKKPESSKYTKYLSLDHCHTTGKVRGLLCRGCNQGLGNFIDSPENLQEAINYLNKNI